MTLAATQRLLQIKPQQELNDGQSKNRRAVTNGTPNEIQLI